MDKVILRIFHFFSPLLEKQGIDVYRMFAIVETKLKMDKRRVYLQMRNYNKKMKENANHLTSVLFVYGVVSLFIAIIIASLSSLVICMIAFHAYLLFMMTMTLVTDFSTVLLDTTDNQVILPRPVSSKTLFAARMVHVFIYLFQFGFVMSVLPIIATAIKFGIGPGLFAIITSFSTTLLAVFFTYLLYLIVLRYANEQKLREIVTYLQIFMTVLFMAGYQVLPRMINLTALGNDFSLSWYSYIAPPVWMAVALEAVQKNLYDNLHIGMIILSVFLPLLLFWMLNKYFAPSFSQKLAAVQTDGSIEKDIKLRKRNKKRLSENLSPILCTSATERAAFELTWKITARDKQFRLQFYPLIGYMLVFVFIFVFKSGQPLSVLWTDLHHTQKFLWFIYIPLFMAGNSIMFTAFNDNYQAAWVYQSSPVISPGHLVSGSLKAVFTKFFLPVFLLMFIFSFAIWHISIVDDFFFGLLVDLNCFLIMALLSKHYLPFSVQPNVQRQTGRFLFAFLQLLIVGFLIGLHYLAIIYPLGFFILIPLAGLSGYFLLKQIQNLSWQKITF